MDMLDAIRSHILALPDLAKFAVIIAAIVGVQRLAATFLRLNNNHQRRGLMLGQPPSNRGNPFDPLTKRSFGDVAHDSRRVRE
jgi:hypothetical protein